jgi:peptidoglycan/LPS O-acetylase OafA/YrhL
VLLCYVLMKVGASHVAKAAAITHSGWLAMQWTVLPHFFDAVKEGTWGIFINGTSAYNNVLWTMTTEFFGSFLVFGFLLLFASSRYRWVLYGLIGLITFNTWFLAFLVGMVFADLYSNGIIKQKVRGIGALALLVLGIFIGGYPIGPVKGTIYEYITLPYITHIDNLVLHMVLAASLIVFAVLSTKQVAHVLSYRRVSTLGRYTFSLYLIHIPVLFTVTTGLFIYLQRHMGYNRAVFLAIVVSVPLLWASAWVFEKYVDAPAIRFARYIADVYQGRRLLPIPEFLTLYGERI